MDALLRHLPAVEAFERELGLGTMGAVAGTSEPRLRLAGTAEHGGGRGVRGGWRPWVRGWRGQMLGTVAAAAAIVVAFNLNALGPNGNQGGGSGGQNVARGVPASAGGGASSAGGGSGATVATGGGAGGEVHPHVLDRVMAGAFGGDTGHGDSPTHDAEGQMLIALYQPPTHPAMATPIEDPTACPECWHVAKWSPGTARVVGASDREALVADSLQRSRVGQPGHMVIVGLSGPRHELPRTEAQARDLALCLLESRNTVGAGAGGGAVKGVGELCAYSCVPPRLDVRIETWSMASNQ